MDVVLQGGVRLAIFGNVVFRLLMLVGEHLQLRTQFIDGDLVAILQAG